MSGETSNGPVVSGWLTVSSARSNRPGCSSTSHLPPQPTTASLAVTVSLWGKFCSVNIHQLNGVGQVNSLHTPGLIHRTMALPEKEKKKKNTAAGAGWGWGWGAGWGGALKKTQHARTPHDCLGQEKLFLLQICLLRSCGLGKQYNSMVGRLGHCLRKSGPMEQLNAV